MAILDTFLPAIWIWPKKLAFAPKGAFHSSMEKLNAACWNMNCIDSGLALVSDNLSSILRLRQ
jgi:hypothetical protein